MKFMLPLALKLLPWKLPATMLTVLMLGNRIQFFDLSSAIRIFTFAVGESSPYEAKCLFTKGKNEILYEIYANSARN